MRRILCLLFATIFAASVGCHPEQAPPPPPQPEIRVERAETADGVSLTIKYKNHPYGQNEHPKTVIDTPEKLTNYKRQVQFLLSQLEEAEKRMSVHEQGGEKKP
jgi:hypothetical protein